MMKSVMTKMMRRTIASICGVLTANMALPKCLPCTNSFNLMKILLWGRSYHNPHLTVENKWGTEMLSNLPRSHSYGNRHHSPKISFFSLGTYPVDISPASFAGKVATGLSAQLMEHERCVPCLCWAALQKQECPPCSLTMYLPSEWRLCWGSGGWQSHGPKGHQWLPPIRNILGVSQRCKIKLSSVSTVYTLEGLSLLSQ